jgi:hypothetical protein
MTVAGLAVKILLLFSVLLFLTVSLGSHLTLALETQVVLVVVNVQLPEGTALVTAKVFPRLLHLVRVCFDLELI